MSDTSLSQQPYFLRALYEWIVDSGYTPYLTVRVNRLTRVPQAYIKDGMIVLNVAPGAVRNFHMDNEWVTFSARFGGMSHSIEIPVENVIAIYARETGEGMGFEPPGQPDAQDDATDAELIEGQEIERNVAPPRGKPQLKVVK
jgi:stringent starvation protein B